MIGMSPVQRQRRGLARMDAILDAAVVVFARDGLERATTNAIAAQAGISPGSLYQYFSNREDILSAVTDRYLTGLRAVYSDLAERIGETGLELEKIVDLVVDPLLAYKAGNAVFVQIYAQIALPETARDAIAEAHHGFVERCAVVLARRNPRASGETIMRGIRQSFALTRGMLPLLGQIHGDEATDVEELKTMMVAYLRSLGLE